MYELGKALGVKVLPSQILTAGLLYGPNPDIFHTHSTQLAGWSPALGPEQRQNTGLSLKAGWLRQKGKAFIAEQGDG